MSRTQVRDVAESTGMTPSAGPSEAPAGPEATLAPQIRPATADGATAVVLELEAVTKSYDGEPPVVALAGVSFAVTEGELVAIVGQSGSGRPWHPASGRRPPTGPVQWSWSSNR